MDAFGSLTECLTDRDRESLGRARNLRGRSMVMAVAIETGLASALLIWPLLHLGALGQAPDLLPKPLFFASRPIIPAGDRSAPRRQQGLFFPALNFRPAAPRTQEQGADSDAPPGIESLAEPATGAFVDLGGNESSVNPPSTHPAEAKPPRLSVGVMDAMLVDRVEPEYPKIAQAIGLAGVVRLDAIIGTDGSIRELRATEGNPILAQAALAAVRQWRYRPTLLGGVPVEVETHISVNFVLR